MCSNTNLSRYHAFPEAVPESLLSSLGKDPAELRRTIEYHESRILHHQKAIAQYRGCLNSLEARINVRLPPELLSRVFEFRMLQCADSSYAMQDPDTEFIRVRPIWFRVALVCRHWRSIALSTPALFSYINLSEAYRLPIAEWLSLSKGTSLKVVGATYGEWARPSNPFDMLLAHLERVQSLKIIVATDMELPPTCPLFLPLMESMYYIFDGKTDSAGRAALCGLLARSPNLTHLTLDFTTVIEMACISYISHKFLTRLKLVAWENMEKGETDSAKLISLVQHLPHLDDLEVASQRVRQPTIKPFRLFTAKKTQPLTRFKASGSIQSIISFLASGTIAPRILDISMGSDGPLDDETVDLVSDVLVNLPGVERDKILSVGFGGSGQGGEVGICNYGLQGFSCPIIPTASQLAKTRVSPVLKMDFIFEHVYYDVIKRAHRIGTQWISGLLGTLPEVKSANIMTPRYYDRGQSPLNPVVMEACAKFGQANDLRISIDTRQGLQVFLTQFEDCELLPHLSALRIIFVTDVNICIDTLYAIYDSLSIRQTRGGSRLECLVLDSWAREWDLPCVSEGVEKVKELVGELQLIDASGLD